MAKIKVSYKKSQIGRLIRLSNSKIRPKKLDGLPKRLRKFEEWINKKAESLPEEVEK